MGAIPTLAGPRPRTAATETEAGRAPTRHTVTERALPRYLQQAAQDRSVRARDDPAEREARSIGAAVARDGQASPAVAPESTAPVSGALPEAIRGPAEGALGADFSGVRVHTDGAAAETARALQARAFTVGEDIAFGAGEYQPGTARGRELLAHELAHVVQQRQSSPSAGAPAIQCDGQGTVTFGTPTITGPSAIGNGAAEQAQWRRRVDDAVRARYGIRGAGVAGPQVEFVDQAEFARRFPANQMEEILFSLFLARGQDSSSVFATILAHNHIPYRYAGPSSPTAVDQVRAFVRDGVARNRFEGQTREYDVTTGRPFPPFSMTPGELIAQNVGGVTDIAPDRRSGRSILMQRGAYVDTLTHEVCHFYISNGFRNMVNARTDGGEYLRGARINQILIEGFAEYFAQQVMDANVATLGPSTGVSYPAEVRVVGDFVQTLGEATVRAAYFGGDANAIARVSGVVDAYKATNPDLLLPDFMIPARPAASRPLRRP